MMKLKAMKDFKFSYNGIEVVNYKKDQVFEAKEESFKKMKDLGYAEELVCKKAVKDLENKAIKDLDNKSMKKSDKKLSKKNSGA